MISILPLSLNQIPHAARVWDTFRDMPPADIAALAKVLEGDIEYLMEGVNSGFQLLNRRQEEGDRDGAQEVLQVLEQRRAQRAALENRLAVLRYLLQYRLAHNWSGPIPPFAKLKASEKLKMVHAVDAIFQKFPPEIQDKILKAIQEEARWGEIADEYKSMMDNGLTWEVACTELAIKYGKKSHQTIWRRIKPWVESK